MSMTIYPRSGSPLDVSLLIDNKEVKRMVWSSGCVSYFGVPLCVGVSGQLNNVPTGSSHTVTFRVNQQTRTSITYELRPLGTYMVPSQNLSQQIFLPERVVTLREGQSVSWSFTLAK
jgi:hypothetical protein